MQNLLQLSLVVFIVSSSLGFLRTEEQQAVFMSLPGNRRIEQPVRLASAGNIWDQIRRKRVPGGSRGPDDEIVFCAIAPGDLEDTMTGERSPIDLWGTQPVFLWQGVWDEWVLYNNEGIEIDSKVLSPQERHFVYYNEADLLKPGQLYLWSLRIKGEIYGQVPFFVVGETEKANIQANLDELTVDPGVEDDIALVRAEYFARNGYFSNAFKELYMMSEIPSEFAEILEREHFCDVSE